MNFNQVSAFKDYLKIQCKNQFKNNLKIIAIIHHVYQINLQSIFLSIKFINNILKNKRKIEYKLMGMLFRQKNRNLN